MTIDPEMLAAYADGELGPQDAAQVEAAIAADPALAAQVDAHRALRRQLSAHFAPILDAPVPDRLTALLRPGAASDPAAAESGTRTESAPLPSPASATILDLASARDRREAAKRRHRTTTTPAHFNARHWAMSGALAASLALGLIVGSRIPSTGPIGTRDGQLVAAGALDKALTTQLAAAQGDAPVRILLSFRARDGRYCRAFEQSATAGIGCRTQDQWTIVRTQSGSTANTSGAYRQAGSSAAAIMAAAQDMAQGPALDASGEQAAQRRDWR